MKQRKAVDLHRALVKAVAAVREPGHMRLVAMGVQDQLGRAGGAAGVKAGCDALRRNLRVEAQGFGLRGQGLLEGGDGSSKAA